MKAQRLRIAAALLSCIGMIAPASAQSTPLTKPTAKVATATHDVALHEGGLMVGQMLDSQGAPLVKQTVQVVKNGKAIAQVQTDKQGKFQVAGLQGGVHVVATGGQQTVYRLWAPRTAPPAARQGLLIVQSSDIVRGQCGCGDAVTCGSPVCGSGCGCGGGGIAGWMANHPVITAGAIATAIAVPLALDDDDAPASP